MLATATESAVRGSLSVLNCGAGDIKITFDSGNEDETARACHMIADMLKRGYILAVLDETTGEWNRVKYFDPKHHEYVVQAEPPVEPAVSESEPVAKKKGGRRKGLPLKKTTAVGIAPTAGG